jgi:ribosomal subunit interface protein
MDVRITSRHTTISDSFRARKEKLLSKLEKYDHRVSAVEVIFDEEKNSKKIEGILHIDRSDPIVASGQGADFKEALRQVNDRLARQLREHHSQVRDHRAPPLVDVLSEE